MNTATRSLLLFLGPLIVVVLWAIVSRLTSANVLLPSPSETGGAIWDLFSSGGILLDLQETLVRMGWGYSLACVIGISIGMLVGTYNTLYQSTYVVMDFFRSIPVTTLYPVFILAFGIGNLSKVAMVFSASVFVIALNSAYGVWHIHKEKRELMKLYRASPIQEFYLVTLPGAMPQTLIGLRIALSYSLIVIVVCEMFMGSQRGMGQRIFEAYNTYAISDLYGLVLIVGLVGYFLNQAFAKLESHVLRWQDR